MLLGIVGKKGVGKDTSADYLCEHHGFVKRAFADPVKEACILLFQLSPTQLEGDNKEEVDKRWDMTPRQMMQLVGTDMFRNMVGPDFWVHRFVQWYDESSEGNVVVPDLRFQNEVDTIKNLGGYIINLSRDSGDGRASLIDGHISETGVDQLTGSDVCVRNNGTLERLYDQIESALVRWDEEETAV